MRISNTYELKEKRIKREYNKRILLTKEEITEVVSGNCHYSKYADKIPIVVQNKLSIIDRCIEIAKQNDCKAIECLKTAKHILLIKKRIKHCNAMDIEDIDTIEFLYEFMLQNNFPKQECNIFKLHWN